MPDVTQVSIPSGVDPSKAAGGGDTTTHGSGHNRSPGIDPSLAVPPATQQQVGHVTTPAAPAAPAGVDAAEFAAFKEWQSKQAAPAPAPAQVAPVPQVAANPEADAANAIAAAKGADDPLVNNTLEMLDLLVPGINLERALGLAIDRGDASLIDRAYLNEVGKDKAAKLVKLAEGMVAHVNGVIDGVMTGLHTTAGSEAGWNAATAAFQNNAPVHLKAWAIDLLNSGHPAKVKQAGEAIIDFARQSGQIVTQPKNHVSAGGGVPNSSLGLSKQQYQEARLKLNRRDRDYESAARELDARRAIGKKMGL